MKKKIIMWILVILWMGVIFYFSSDDSETSTSKSRGIIESTTIIERIENDNPIEKEELLKNTDIILRKVAHASEYFVLSILVCFLIKEYTLDIKKILLIAFFICLLYACSDEVHQIYVEGRSGEVRDVIIDSIGSCIGYLVFYLSGMKIWKKKVG